ARVLIIDPLAPLLSANGIEENDNARVAEVLNAIDTLAVEGGVSEVLITHHMGHGGERSRGASRLRDWPDAEWKLVRENDENGEPQPDATRFFSALGRDVELSEQALEFDKATRHLRIVGGSRKDHKGGRAREIALEVVRSSPGINTRDLYAAIQGRGTSDRAARDAVRDLIDDQSVHRAPGSGRAFLHFADCDCDQPAQCASASFRK